MMSFSLFWNNNKEAAASWAADIINLACGNKRKVAAELQVLKVVHKTFLRVKDTVLFNELCFRVE